MAAVTAQLGDSARTMDTRESYEQTYNTLCNYDCEGDRVATEEALTSDEKAIKEYWQDEDQNIFDSKKWIKAATIGGLETKLNSSQRTWWGT